MKILYGTTSHSIDVTDICLTKLVRDSVIIIPSGDENRAAFFTDPLLNVLKQIFIEINGTITEYDYTYDIQINTVDGTVSVKSKEDILKIHSKLKIKYGTFNEELPEQKMTYQYLMGHEKVLEIGGNIGRNTLVIASILKDHRNLVSMECDSSIAEQLTENRNLNQFTFHIENAALSKRKLIHGLGYHAE
jgi:hypothetical protein